MPYEKTYTVIVKYSLDEEGEYNNLSKNEAIGLASSLAKENDGAQVFIERFRKGDGQLMYLNEDGFSLTGKSWA